MSGEVRERPDLPAGMQIRLDYRHGHYVSAECQNGACWSCRGGAITAPRDGGPRQLLRCTCSREGCGCRAWYETNGPERASRT